MKLSVISSLTFLSLIAGWNCHATDMTKIEKTGGIFERILKHEIFVPNEPIRQGRDEVIRMAEPPKTKGRHEDAPASERLRKLMGGTEHPTALPRGGRNLSHLGKYLKIEYQGRMSRPDALGERLIENEGIAELYEAGEVLPVMKAMEDLIVKGCTADSIPKRHLSRKRAILEKMRHSKNPFLDSEHSSEASRSARRLALLAFMSREWTENRGMKDKEIAGEIFAAEFAENFLSFLDEKSKSRNEILVKEGPAAIHAYDNFSRDTEQAAKYEASASSDRNSSGNSAVEELQHHFALINQIGCSVADREMAKLLAKKYAAIMNSVEWTPENRRLILEAILPRQEKEEEPEEEEFHFEKKIFDKGSYLQDLMNQGASFELEQKMRLKKPNYENYFREMKTPFIFPNP